ncbi:MAG TPA: hypothetical protein VFW63_05920 [Acidimicrobiales bacterium]|nr:hypothetical protein [Acidimicrobiales bacterium]
MATCQLISFTDRGDRVLLDIVPLEALDIDDTRVPRGMPLSLGFAPSDDPRQHREMVDVFDRWAGHDGVVDLDVDVTREVGGVRYVFTQDDEQLVLDVQG